MPFDKIEIPTPKELFIKKIQERIIKGKLVVGEKLPTERELETQTGISKSVIHFALKDLEHMGFVEIIPRRGAYVADYARKGSMETLNEILKYRGGKISYKMSVDMVEMRNAIEGAALIKLAANHTNEDMAQLRAVLNEIRILAGKDAELSEVAKMSRKFHSLVCELSGNDIFALIMNAFGPVANVLWENCAAFWGAKGFSEQDERILDMIERGEGHEAKKYIEDIFAQFLEAFANGT